MRVVAGEDLLRVPPERRHVPRVDVERLAARALLDHAVGIAVVFEGGGLPVIVDHRLQPAVLVPGHAAVLVAIGGVPAGLVAVEVVEEGVVAGLARGVRPPAGVGVRRSRSSAPRWAWCEPFESWLNAVWVLRVMLWMPSYDIASVNFCVARPGLAKAPVLEVSW